MEAKDLQVFSLASGSSGNAYLVRHQKQALLLDAGLSGKRTLAGLAEIGVDPASISGILITHEHNDHIAGAGILSRRFNLPLYMTKGTWVGASRKLGKIEEKNVYLIEANSSFVLGNLEITAIPICHDAREPVNYVFDSGKCRAAVLTDTGSVPSSILKILATCQAMVLEANHDGEMLRTGPYPWPLKQRVGGELGHLSNLQAARVAAWLAINGKIRQIQLGHLSAVNNNPNFALAAVSQFLVSAGLGAELVCRNLQVLPRQRGGPVLQVYEQI